MCLATTNDETPRTCATCGAEIQESAPGFYECCSECAEEFGVRPAINAYDSERYLNSAWQEEQYSARYEDRYGPDYDPYED